MTIKTTLSLAFLAVMLMSIGPAANAQLALSDDEMASERSEHILANLKYSIPPLREAFVVMGDISASETAGLDIGSFTVNGQVYKYLVTSDDATLYLLGADPLDITLSPQEIAAALAEEYRAAEVERLARHEDLLAFTDGMPVRGNPDAPVTIVEFSDFECPYCSRAFRTVEEVLAKYPNDVNFVYLNFPLDNHPWAMPAAVAALCAAEQDDQAFWTLHDGYFRNQQTITPANVIDVSREFLTEENSAIDMEAWANCSSNPGTESYAAAMSSVRSAMTKGSSYGVSGTPGFFINGLFVNGAQPIETFDAVIAEMLQISQ